MMTKPYLVIKNNCAIGVVFAEGEANALVIACEAYCDGVTVELSRQSGLRSVGV